MRMHFCVGLSLAIAPFGFADFTTDFEPPTYNASPTGIALANQDGWYVPAVAGSIGFNAHTYAGNVYALPANPDGDAQFAAGRSEGGAANAFARAQRDFDFSTSQTWCFTWDFACKFDGTPPATDNLASFSLQPGAVSPPTNRIFIALNNFMGDHANPTVWGAGYIVHSAAGVQVTQPGLFAGPEWQNLPFNTWFRQTTEVNMTQNRIVSVSITNLTTGATATAAPIDWYLGGGAAPALPLATSVRFFAGGTTPGNIAAFDNFSISASCGSNPCPADLDNSGDVGLQDLAILLSNFGRTDNPPAGAGNLDGDGDVDLQDLATLLAAFGTSC
jgi:hypothetical protein